MTYHVSHVWTKIRPAEAFLVAWWSDYLPMGKNAMERLAGGKKQHYPHRGCFCFAGGWWRCRIWRVGGWEKVPRLGCGWWCIYLRRVFISHLILYLSKSFVFNMFVLYLISI